MYVHLFGMVIVDDGELQIKQLCVSVCLYVLLLSSNVILIKFKTERNGANQFIFARFLEKACFLSSFFLSLYASISLIVCMHCVCVCICVCAYVCTNMWIKR